MLIDGKSIKEKILDELKIEVSKLDSVPSLCVIQIGDDAASNVYINQKRKMCEYVGYNFIHRKYSSDVTQVELKEDIERLNEDSSITSLLIQMPISKHLNEKEIQNYVDPRKDVDGLTDKNVVNLITNKDGLFPCTASGVLRLLDEYNINPEGKNVTIVGRSFLVGTPLFYMLENRNATVTLCHSKTNNLKDNTINADIVICAVGKINTITSDMIKDGAVVIDVGINRIDNKLYGDCDFANLENKTSYITPVPGGVGPMTIASLAINILKSYKMQKEKN